MTYDIIQVCENGHKITDCYFTHSYERQEFCTDCGAKTITSCPKCKTQIKGAPLQIGCGGNYEPIESVNVPAHCIDCGEPFPWTKKRDEKKEISTESTEKILGNDVFIVHGHDEAAKESVARFIEKLELKPIILHEQPDKGRTVIEKFEDHSNVGFAIVLLTPDDMGAPIDQKEKLKPRARQNVIFELGFFIGKLGRNRVCALYKGDLEMPSDYKGVLYKQMVGNWQLSLAKEIKAAGISIDLNKAI